jgi:hypothetical protein
MKKLSLALLLTIPVYSYAFDYQKFAVEDTLKCSHPTVERTTAKTVMVSSPVRQGDKETAQVKILYSGLIKQNSMLVEYEMMTNTNPMMIHGKVLADTSSVSASNIPGRGCAYFQGWQELKQ